MNLNQQENHEKRAAIADLQERIFKVFQQSRNNYGTRKIKRELEKQGLTVSRQRIGRVMKALGLDSNYTVAYYKPQKKSSNEAVIANVLNRICLLKSGAMFNKVVRRGFNSPRSSTKPVLVCIIDFK